MIKSAESTARNTPQTQIFDVFDYGKKIRSLHKKIISLPEKIVLWDLSDRFGNNGKIFPSNGEIAESTGLPSKTVMNCLSGLKSKKFLNYKKQHNKNRRYIDLFDPEIAVANLIDGVCQWGAKLIPKLSLVGDSTIPDQGVPYNRKEHKNRKKQQQPRPAVDCVVVPLFDSKIENALKDRPDIQRKWIQQSLKLHGQSVKNIILAIKESNTKDNPTGFIRNALEEYWRFDTQPQQYQSRPQSQESPPAKPQKGIAFKEQGFDSFENKREHFLKAWAFNDKIFKYYNDMDNDRLSIQAEFVNFEKGISYETDSRKSKD